MGAESWQTWTKWKKDLKTTLHQAQQEALEEQGYESVEEALEVTEADGTASVIDIGKLTKKPEPAGCWQLSKEQLEETFGTATPTRAQIEDAVDELTEDLGRGESLCVVAYAKSKKTQQLEPVEVLFSGWSFD